jgi:universal stress protein A
MGIYNHVLCAIDFSHHSEAACARAISLVNNLTGQLTLLHVVENFPEVRSNEIIAPENIDPAEYRKHQAQKRLSELAKQLQYEQAIHQVVFTPYSAWHEIVRFAIENKVDLIVLGSNGSFGISALLGSTAHGVVNHALCDVLTVRAIV